jgi:hypothetical protein
MGVAVERGVWLTIGARVAVGTLTTAGSSPAHDASSRAAINREIRARDRLISRRNSVNIDTKA